MQFFSKKKLPRKLVPVRCLKKEMSDEFDFLHADQPESLKATNWYYDFDGDGQAFPKFPK